MQMILSEPCIATNYLNTTPSRCFLIAIIARAMYSCSARSSLEALPDIGRFFQIFLEVKNCMKSIGGNDVADIETNQKYGSNKSKRKTTMVEQANILRIA
jgi:hypothetical protein